MLSFATEFPVETTRTSVDFLAAVREWLLGSPHTVFEASDLSEIEARMSSQRKSQTNLLRRSSTKQRAAIWLLSVTRSGIVASNGYRLLFFRVASQAGSEFALLVSLNTLPHSFPIAKKPVFVQAF